MKGSMGVAMLAMMVMALVMQVQPSEAFSCSDFTNMLSPCIGYLRSGGSPSQSCCSGARRVQGATKSQADRRAACNCAKAAAGRLQIRADAANSLPSRCGISTTIPINPNVNCNTIP